jgi:hypothetical protein
LQCAEKFAGCAAEEIDSSRIFGASAVARRRNDNVAGGESDYRVAETVAGSRMGIKELCEGGG